MVRHGESEWNKLNLFCGWYDANLSDKGKINKYRRYRKFLQGQKVTRSLKKISFLFLSKCKNKY